MIAERPSLSSNSTWRAYCGVGYALALIVLSLGINEALRTGYRHSSSFARWVRANSYLAETAFMLLRGFLWALLALIFSGGKSLRAFAT